MAGNAHPVLAAGGRSIAFSRNGQTVLRYTGLSANDAKGQALRSWLTLESGRVVMRIDSQRARYPVRIDPFIQQGPKLTGSEESGEGSFGQSVALSSDGNTALIGGPEDNNGAGAVWVFTRSGSTWTQQGPKLTGGEESGEKSFFGSSVALSSDGDTALIGGPEDDNYAGAAWVFTRSGSTWAQQGPKLTAGIGITAGFGSSVALSSDGDTALIGSPTGGEHMSTGAAWVFTRSGSTWTQQGPMFTGDEEIGAGSFGQSVALSSDGNTALIGGPSDNTYIGAAWVFTRSGSTWTQQGPKLTSSEKSAHFGWQVALSSNGDTALIGSAGNGVTTTGAAWVFTRSGSTWTQQGPKLTREESYLGLGGVALSSDGNTALIGGDEENNGAGEAAVFTRSGSTWTQQEPELTGSEESGELSFFGSSVALSSDGNTALIGGPEDNNGAGAAWVFAPAGGPISGAAPQVQTLPASDVTTTGATLHGSVNPNGAALSDCHFDLGTTTGYGRTVGCDPSSVGAGSAPVAISALIGVDPGATYHYRLVATNANGTADGEDQTFTTSGTQSPDPSGAWGLIVSSAPGSSEMDAALTIGGWNPAAGTFTGSGHQLAVISGRHLIPAHGAINLAGRFVQHLATYSCSILLPCVYLALDLPDSTLLTLSGSSSCLPPFSMCWTGTGTDNHGFKYSWYACKGCAGRLPSQVIKRFSQSVAKSDQECSDFLGAAGDSGAGTLGPWGEVVNWVSTALSFLCDAGSGDAAAIAADPPDSRYGSIVSPEFGKPLWVPRGVPRRQQRLLQKWIDEEREDAALRHALRVSLERAEGATEAGDGKWTLRQMIAVSEFARQDASALYEEAHTLVKLRRALAATGAVNPLITANEVRRAQNHLKRHGFRPAMRRLLIRAGANQSQLTDLRAQIVQASPRKLRGRVFSRFTSPAYIGRLTTFADQLKEYAVTVAEHPLG